MGKRIPTVEEALAEVELEYLGEKFPEYREKRDRQRAELDELERRWRLGLVGEEEYRREGATLRTEIRLFERIDRALRWIHEQKVRALLDAIAENEGAHRNKIVRLALERFERIVRERTERYYEEQIPLEIAEAKKISLEEAKAVARLKGITAYKEGALKDVFWRLGKAGKDERRPTEGAFAHLLRRLVEAKLVDRITIEEEHPVRRMLEFVTIPEVQLEAHREKGRGMSFHHIFFPIGPEQEREQFELAWRIANEYYAEHLRFKTIEEAWAAWLEPKLEPAMVALREAGRMTAWGLALRLRVRHRDAARMLDRLAELGLARKYKVRKWWALWMKVAEYEWVGGERLTDGGTASPSFLNHLSLDIRSGFRADEAVARFLRSLGESEVRVRRRTSEGEIDVESEHVVVEVKNASKSNPLRPSDVEKFAKKAASSGKRGWIVATSAGRGARKKAKELGIGIVETGRKLLLPDQRHVEYAERNALAGTSDCEVWLEPLLRSKLARELRIVNLYESGASQSELKRRLGIKSVRAIYAALRKYGIPLRRSLCPPEG